MLGRTDSRRRTLLLLAVLLVFGAACVARLGTGSWPATTGSWRRPGTRSRCGPRSPRTRGTIYDRSGTVALATTIRRDRLVAYPASLAGETPAAGRSARRSRRRWPGILGLGGDAAAELRRRLDSGKAYVVLARGLTTDQSSAVRAAIDGGALAQVRLEPEAVRVYPLDGGAPKTTIAAHLLGFANREGDGQYGVEGRWQDDARRRAAHRPRRARRLGAPEPGAGRRRWRRAAPGSTSR